MYNQLKELRSYTEDLENAVNLIDSIIKNDEDKIEDERAEIITHCLAKLSRTDLYLLLESIFLMSPNFNNTLIKGIGGEI